jgi:uncharacterized protein YdeI (YjbR/CyaY-like superfamily)
LKWGQPCYSYQKSNVVIIQAFKAYCAIMFFKGSLLQEAMEVEKAGLKVEFKKTGD